jgi:hypothetical protein
VEVAILHFLNNNSSFVMDGVMFEAAGDPGVTPVPEPASLALLASGN